MLCKVCGKDLTEAQYAMKESYKSCPRRSTKNGEEHVFFRYPESFGESDKRITTNHPRGAQSYCSVHRSNSDRAIPVSGILCSQLNE